MWLISRLPPIGPVSLLRSRREDLRLKRELHTRVLESQIAFADHDDPDEPPPPMFEVIRG